MGDRAEEVAEAASRGGRAADGLAHAMRGGGGDERWAVARADERLAAVHCGR